MTTFGELPPEIIINILKYLQCTEDRMPIIGLTASLTRQQEYLPKGLDDINGSAEYPNSIAALRLTNHRLNEICSPFLYRHINVINNSILGNPKIFDMEQNEERIGKHFEHIRTIRVSLDSNARSEQLAEFLEKCVNLRSLGLYYHRGSTNTDSLAESVVKLMENGQLDTLGIYSNSVVEYHPQRDWEYLPVNAPMAILQAILKSNTACSALQVLDITTEAMYKDVYDGIRSRLNNLRSLTVHRGFRYTLGDMWGGEASLKWSPKANLTRLQLSNCQNAHASMIPDFVCHFESLRELWIVACGHHTDTEGISRPRGWSKEPDAIHKRRAPLDELLIEHMDDWEILALGPIPTTKLVLISMGSRSVLQTFLRDPEVFPGTKVLVTVPAEPNDVSQLAAESAESDETETGNSSNNNNTGGVTLEVFCHERGMEWRNDAQRLRFCNAICCRDQW